jgi:hypothetical protein
MAMTADQLAEADSHRFLDHARRVDVTRELEQLGAFVLGVADAREPGCAAPKDGRDNRDALDVVDRRRAAVEAGARGERRLQARLALLALQAFEHRRLFAADVGARAAVDEAIEIVARTGCVLAEQPGLIAFGNSLA